MDKDDREFVRGAYTFSAKLAELAENPKYLARPSALVSTGKPSVAVCESSRAELSQVLALFANVVYAFAEAAEVELGDPDPAPPGRVERKP